jgi:hypothetical protein
MRTLIWSLVLLVNLAIAVAFAPSVFEPDLPAQSRFIAALVGMLFSTVFGFLIAARHFSLPIWGRSMMKLLCSAIPLSFLLGSLDSDKISGQESISLIFAALLGWGTWRAFLNFSSKPSPSINPDAAR